MSDIPIRTLLSNENLQMVATEPTYPGFPFLSKNAVMIVRPSWQSFVMRTGDAETFVFVLSARITRKIFQIGSARACRYLLG